MAELNDDEMIGVLRAWRRLESWCSAGILDAIAELARRRPADRTPPAADAAFPAHLSEFIGDEVAAALTMTGRTADAYLELALDLATRLPATARALKAGVFDLPRARLIADLTRVLSDEHAHQVEDKILPTAGQQTTGQLRAKAARAVLAVDPAAAIRRREEAQKDPRVRRWPEDAGTAALAGYGLPPADVLQADQRITERALHLREAGLPGSLEELRARAYLDALLGHDSAPPAAQCSELSPSDEDQDSRCAPNRESQRSGATPSHPDQSPSPSPHYQDQSPSPSPSHPDQSPSPHHQDQSPSPAPSHQDPHLFPGDSQEQRLAARVTLTVPLLTQLGQAAEPGVVAGYGPVDPALARELTARAAAHPVSRFCVTVTGADGQAIGHGCMPGRPPDLSPPGASGFTVRVSPLAGEDCDHRHQEAAYQPSRQLRHLIWARNPTCGAPGCRRPAARCDLDHTVPYDQGGRTCECGLAPLCRHHHRCKQSEGWRLEQPSPGVMRWTTPAGRRYVTGPGPGH